MSARRQTIMAEVDEAMRSGARQSTACEVIGISAKTLQRWARPDNGEDGRLE
ncbi:MAG: putative transposase, partial [Gammaproteobacteria bacterium]